MFRRLGQTIAKLSKGADEGAGVYNDLFSLMDDSAKRKPSLLSTAVKPKVPLFAEEGIEAAPRISLYTSGAATVKPAAGPVGLADPRLGKIPDIQFTTNMVGDGKISVVAHRPGAKWNQESLGPSGEGILGYMHGTLRPDKTAYVGATESYETGIGLGAAMLEKFGQSSSKAGMEAIEGVIYGPEALTNRIRVFGETATTSERTGRHVKFGDVFEEDILGNYGKFRTELPQQQSSARRAAQTITPDKTIGSGHSSGRSGLPRRGGG